jgi:serpin B
MADRPKMYTRVLAAALVVVAACGAPVGQTAPVAPTASVPSATPEATQPPTPTPSAIAPTDTPPPGIAAIAPITEVRSSIGRKPAGSQGVEEITAADADFAFRLYHQLIATSQENLFFSPYSISTALSMGLAGARTDTADEMRAVLGVDDEQAWHDARNSLNYALANQGRRSHPVEGEAEPLTLETTNAIFGEQSSAFRDAFLDLLAANYGAGMQAVDFVNNPEAARRGINGWVAERTQDRIQELLAQGSVDPLTRAVLVNTVYFKANWYWKFSPDNTAGEPFHLLDGSSQTVQMMHSSPDTGYASGPKWAAVQLPYWGSMSMIVIVPDDGAFADVEQKLNPAFIAHLVDGLTEHEVHLSLPRWESESALSLVDVLRSLGMIDAFDPNVADFSGIADEQLYIGDVAHQANVSVDEAGTEAAAATAVLIFAVCRCPPPEVTLTIDRPFIYLIRDDVTGEILFLGRLLEP